MPFTLKCWLVTTAAATIMIARPACADAEKTADEAAILNLMEKFDAAIRNRDLPAMKALFYNGEIVWKGTANAKVREIAKKRLGKDGPEIQIGGAADILGDEKTRHHSHCRTFL